MGGMLITATVTGVVVAVTDDGQGVGAGVAELEAGVVVIVSAPVLGDSLSNSDIEQEVFAV